MGKTTRKIARQTLADTKAPAALKTQASNYLNDCRAGSYDSAAANRYGFFNEHHNLCRTSLASAANVRQIAKNYDYQPIARAAEAQAKQQDADCGCCVIS